MFRRYFLPRLAYWLYRAWSATWRITVVESAAHRILREGGKARVFAHWHRDELAMVKHAGTYRIAAMTSHSKDGQLIDFVVRRLGGATAKGSSSRGGAAALHGLIKLVKAGYSASFAVDGPRGPIFKSKPGVFKLGLLTGAIIVPVGLASRTRHIFKRSWNRARLPLPFTRVVLVFGEPLIVDWAMQTDPQCPLLAARLDAAIAGACRLAQQEGLRLIAADNARAGGFDLATP